MRHSWASALALLTAGALASAPKADAQTISGPPAPAHAARADRPPPLSEDRPTPGRPLLGAPDTAGRVPSGGEEGVVDGGAQSGDPLVANGFGGALCRNTRLRQRLGADARENCENSGVAAATAPLSHYGFDVHIDTGFAGVSSRTFAAAVQNLILTPLWGALLWLVHAVIAALEWSYALDLLDHATMGSVADALDGARRAFTDPWLAAALALAAIAALYHGLVRRAVAETLGQAALMVAMMLGGLLVIANPAGTVGELNRLVNDASLGTMAAVASGNPDRAERSFADGLQTVFDAAIRAPWCYLQFGDVDWCQNPRRLDADLAAAGRRIRRELLDDARCTPGAPRREGLCRVGDERIGADRLRQARLIAAADTNGDLFLALPANGPQRNAISDEGSLYRALCASDDDNDCRGPGAEQAKWRTESGTWPRAGGLILITAGVVGMLCLLVFIAARLLGAAILGVLYLLLAPVAVLAPALGEGGRAVFRGWGARLLGALIAKLIYSVLLGVVLVVLGLLAAMGSLGWWTQWLLIAALWWVVFTHRHELLRYATLGHQQTGVRGLRLASSLFAARQAAQITSEAQRRVATGRREVATRRAAVAERTHAAREQADRLRLADDSGAAHARRADQVGRSLDHEHRDAAALAARAPRAEAAIAALQGRRRRLADALDDARRDGDQRRTRRLETRLAAVDARLGTGQARLRSAHEELAAAAASRHATGDPHTARRRADREALLDHQAGLRRGVPPGPRADPHSYRDYPRLAGLAGVSRERYLQMAPGEQRWARLQVDRQLRQRERDRAAVSAARDAGLDQPRARDALTLVPEHAPVKPRHTRSARERQFAAVRRPNR